MDQVVVFDHIYWTLLLTNVIPFLVSLIANEVTRKGVKEGLLFILSGITAFAEEASAEGSFVIENFVVTLAAIFLGSAGFFFAWQRKTVAPELERHGLSFGAPKSP